MFEGITLFLLVLCGKGFVVSRESVCTPPEAARSVNCLDVAESAYDAAEVFGSPDKTVRGEDSFKVIGAEVHSDARGRGAGVVTVSAPASKRLPMLTLSLSVAQMPCISKAIASRCFMSSWELDISFHVPAPKQLCSGRDL